ncbi:MAG: FAD-dependent oxidoreductase [Synergistes sp.]|nr:FAD-dependent oxidoreductase [Synergistes sp.]
MANILKHTVDLTVIGGGPAGLGAAISAKKSGVKNVLLLERSEELGGVLPQCIHNGFGLHFFKEELTGPAYTYRMLKNAEEAHVDFITKAMAVGISCDNTITALSHNKVIEIHSGSTILCMGCRERSFGALRIPGTRPAGIYTAGTAQRLMNIEGMMPGKRVVILGSGDIGMIMARRLTLEGAKVLAVVELMPFIGGLIRNEIQCLRDFGIPIYVGHTIKEVKGTDRVEKVTIAAVDKDRKYIPGTEVEFEADTLLVSAGLIPENELSKMAGVQLNGLTGGPLVDNLWQTNIPGIFAGGNVVHVHDLADYASESAAMAASNAAAYANGDRSLDLDIKVTAGKNIRYVVPNSITKAQENITFFMRVTWPLNNATVHIGNIYNKKLIFARPSEQIRVDLPANMFTQFNHGEIVVSCDGEVAV